MNAREHLASRYVDRHPESAARALHGVDAEVVARFIHAARPGHQDVLLRAMTSEDAAACVRALPPDVRAAVAERMSLERAAPVVRLLPEDVQRSLMADLSAPRRRRLQRVLRYRPDSAGGLADVEVPMALEDHTVGEALKRGHRRGPDLPYIYVTDREQRLVGVVSRRELGRAPSDARLGDVMSRATHRLPAFTPGRELRTHPGWQDLDVLPVVDGTGVLVGVLRHKTLRRPGTAEVTGTPAEAGGTVAVGMAYCDLLARGFVALTTAPAGPESTSASMEGASR